MLEAIGGDGIAFDAQARLCQLGCLDLQDWLDIGLSERAATRVQAAFELAKRLPFAPRIQRPECRTPEQVMAILAPRLGQVEREELWLLYLDPHSSLIGAPFQVSIGDVDGTEVPVRAVLHEAIRRRALSMIMVHNHPSGSTCPSAADRAVTTKTCQAGRQLEISLCDHIIVGRGGGFYSLRRQEPSLFR